MEKKLVEILTDYILRGYTVTNINNYKTFITATIEKELPAVMTFPERTVEREITVYNDLSVEDFKTR